MAYDDNITQVLGSSAFTRKILEAGAAKLLEEAKTMAKEMEGETDAIVGREFAPRDDERSKEGNIPLAGSFTCAVEGDGVDAPIRFVMTSSSNPKKVFSLEKGSPSHNIFPVNGEFLYFPAGTATSTRRARGSGKLIRKDTVGMRNPYRPPSARALEQARAGGPMIKSRGVWHPGNRAYAFMRRGMERVINRRLRGARL